MEISFQTVYSTEIECKRLCHDHILYLEIVIPYLMTLVYFQ